MSDLPHEPKPSAHGAGKIADLEQERAAAKAGYQGVASVSEISDAVKKRNHKHAERERQDAKVHYLGIPPQKPR
jgi:hypothetical protein